jgi:hypothetical protein
MLHRKKSLKLTNRRAFNEGQKSSHAALRRLYGI